MKYKDKRPDFVIQCAPCCAPAKVSSTRTCTQTSTSRSAPPRLRGNSRNSSAAFLPGQFGRDSTALCAGSSIYTPERAVGPKTRIPTGHSLSTQLLEPPTGLGRVPDPTLGWEESPGTALQAAGNTQTHFCRTAAYGASKELTVCHNMGAHAVPFQAQHPR